MPDLSSIKEYLKSMLGLNGLQFINKETIYYLKNYITIIIISCIAATPVVNNVLAKAQNNKVLGKTVNILQPVCILGILVICTASLLSNSFNPFIYFRF